MKHGIGVIGVGVWGCHSLEQVLHRTHGNAHVIAVSTDSQWGETCFAEPPIEYGRRYAAELGAQFMEDWRAVVAHPEVDIVSVMVCPRRKARVCAAALKAGKAVVTDKPLAFTVNEARALRILDRENGRGFMLAGYHHRPHVARLIRAIRDGRLGEVRAMSLRLLSLASLLLLMLLFLVGVNGRPRPERDPGRIPPGFHNRAVTG
jgi:predicted dehydrogenase